MNWTMVPPSANTAGTAARYASLSIATTSSGARPSEYDV